MKSLKKMLFTLMLVIIPVLLVGCSPAETGYKVSNAYVTVDINPSIEIITGENGLVVQVNALNQDAQVLLVDTDFIGKTVDQVTAEIIELAMELGYIQEDVQNSMIITAEAGVNTKELQEKLASKVHDLVKKRQIRLELLEETLNATQDIRSLAAELNVSIGKMKLITKAMLSDETLTLEVAATMSVKDLNKIIIEDINEIKDFFSTEFKDEYLKSIQELELEYQKARIELLNEAIQNAEVIDFDENDDDKLTQEQILEIKSLYQEYTTEILAISTENNESADLIYKLMIESLTTLKNTIKDQLNEYILNFDLNNLDEDEKDFVKDKIEDFKERIEDLDDQIEDILDDLEDDDNDLKRKYNNFRYKYRPYRQLKQTNEKYDDLLDDEYDIDLEDLEELFEENIKTQLQELKDQYKKDLELIKVDFKGKNQILKEQLLKEKEILRKIWKK